MFQEHLLSYPTESVHSHSNPELCSIDHGRGPWTVGRIDNEWKVPEV